VHITSMGLKNTPRLIAMVKGARERGLDVTTECYPYTAEAPSWNQPYLTPDGRPARHHLQGHSVDEDRANDDTEEFEKYRREGGTVVIFSIPERSYTHGGCRPDSHDCQRWHAPFGRQNPPTGPGDVFASARAYVREEKALDLMTALRKMTLMPAQRLEKRAPMFKDKGRIRVGADADITVFDADRIIDKATYEEPLRYSEGFNLC